MTYRVENFRWVNPFRKLFNLKDVSTGEQFSLNRSIQPVLDMSERTSPAHITGTFDLSGVAGTYVPALTAGTDERITVKLYRRYQTTGNSRVAVSDGTNVIELTATGTAASGENVICDILLIKGWSIGQFATGNGADNARPFHLIAEVETRKLDRGSSSYYSGDLEGGAF